MQVNEPSTTVTVQAAEPSHAAAARTIGLVASAGLAIACFLVLRPFLSALIWAALLAFSTWPIFRMLRERARLSPSLAALLMVVAAFLLIGLPAGAWVDRWRKQRVLVANDLIRAVALGSLPLAWVLDVLTFPQMLLVALTVGACTVFFDVAYQSYLPDIVERIEGRPERFLVFCDDLSFDEGEPGYKALKSILDGSVAQAGDNLLVYATSNRRHLLPEYMRENLTYKHTDDGEVHPGEGVEEKISLSERFGLWISFYPFSQPEYLAIVAQWLRHFGVPEGQIEAARQPSLVWALERGSRSGRVAWQYIQDLAGRLGKKLG